MGPRVPFPGTAPATASATPTPPLPGFAVSTAPQWYTALFSGSDITAVSLPISSNCRAMPFMVTTATTLSSLGFGLYQATLGSAPTTFSVALMLFDTAAGVPTGGILASTTATGPSTEAGGTSNYLSVVLGGSALPYALAPNTAYAIVLYAASSGNQQIARTQSSDSSSIQYGAGFAALSSCTLPRLAGTSPSAGAWEGGSDYPFCALFTVA